LPSLGCRFENPVSTTSFSISLATKLKTLPQPPTTLQLVVAHERLVHEYDHDVHAPDAGAKEFASMGHQ
jgi:hypothetical protein